MQKLTTIKDPTIIKRLVRQVKQLASTGRLGIADAAGETLHIAAVFSTYKLATDGQQDIIAQAPGGFRLLLAGEPDIKAALDFHYKGQRLFFTHTIIGQQLEQFVTAVNQLEETYRLEKKVFELGYIDVPLSHKIYLTAYKDSQHRFYRLDDGRVSKILARQLQQETARFKKHSQPFTTI